MKTETKKFIIAVSILIGACIGGGFLAIPYVAAQAGFFVVIAYLLIIGSLLLILNLYFGELCLRTKGNHQVIGYANRYLGKFGKHTMEFATVFGLYAALVAYMFAVGESLSFLIFGDVSYGLYFGIIFGFFMSILIKGGMGSLKKFEKTSVFFIFIILIVICIVFSNRIDFNNYFGFNPANIFLPFGVILFSLLSFHAIPVVRISLKNNEKVFKKSIITGLISAVVFYIIFTFIVLGFSGINTPQISTLALGSIFTVLGILTIFGSYLSCGNALTEDFQFDERHKFNSSWFLASIIPILIFVLTQFFKFFSFTTILSIGGIVSGGITAIVILLMAKKAKKKGDRKPEYSIPIKWWIVGLISLIFTLGILFKLFLHLN